MLLAQLPGLALQLEAKSVQRIMAKKSAAASKPLPDDVDASGTTNPEGFVRFLVFVITIC